MMRRRLACCTRDRDISLDFDEQESKALIPIFFSLNFKINIFIVNFININPY